MVFNLHEARICALDTRGRGAAGSLRGVPARPVGSSFRFFDQTPRTLVIPFVQRGRKRPACGLHYRQYRDAVTILVARHQMH